MHEAVHEAPRRAHADMGEGRGRSEAECKQRQPQARPLHGTLPEFFSRCKKAGKHSWSKPHIMSRPCVTTVTSKFLPALARDALRGKRACRCLARGDGR